MKIIKYKFLSCRINHGTEENPKYEDVILDKEIRCAEAYLESNLEAAKKEAYSEPIIEDDDEFDNVTAPRNIVAGEYITIEGVLYKATENIPNGEPIIIGQNAIVTTVEEQLYELMNNKEE